MLSARSGHAEGVAFLINAGAKVYPSNRHGDTALMLASFGGYENIVDMLLAKGGSLDGNARGWTPLHYAAFAGHARLVEKFLDRHANINAKTQIDLTPLMVAAMNGHLEVVKILLKHHADTTPRDANGRSARDHALARGNTTIADELVRAAPKK
jgi:ankyrin repeat protein